LANHSKVRYTIGSRFETYSSSESLVVYVSASKKTLLLPILAQNILNIFTAALSSDMTLEYLLSQLNESALDDSVKNIVSVLEKAELLKLDS